MNQAIGTSLLETIVVLSSQTLSLAITQHNGLDLVAHGSILNYILKNYGLGKSTL